VQANGVFSPDGQHVTFARSLAPTLATTPSNPVVALSIDEASELLGGPQYLDESRPGYNRFKYDLYTMPFNNGEGGTPVPVRGASHNGKSNYFPAYSPDGKWLVYNQAESFMLLNPDSRLYIMPAEGGEPRLMNCNTASMNSWHSWSPNSKWLVFSSKLFSPYTQLFLTHIDENGVDTPPVLLQNFVIPERAANIPEFVNIDPDATRVIRERFIDDYNYFRQGKLFEIFGRTTDAQDQFLESLRLNPENTDARLALGIMYTHQGELGKAETEFKAILELMPQHAYAHFGLGNIHASQGNYSAAIEAYQRSLESGDNEPEFEVSAYLKIGRCRFLLEDNAGASREFETVLAMDPQNSEAHVHLGNIALRRGDLERAIGEFEDALELDPSIDSLREKIDELRLQRED
jgi:tetratricopeptide (TPR) repeat protein